jgi:hypothetical protein
MRSAASFAEAALFILAGLFAAPSSRATALDKTVRCVLESFDIVTSVAWKQHALSPARPRKPEVSGAGRFRRELVHAVAGARNALIADEVQSVLRFRKPFVAALCSRNLPPGACENQQVSMSYRLSAPTYT